VRIKEAKKWHIEGEIINRNPEFISVNEDYFKDFKTQSYSKTESKVKQIIAQQILELEEDSSERNLRI
jgi:hypothetical protein